MYNQPDIVNHARLTVPYIISARMSDLIEAVGDLREVQRCRRRIGGPGVAQACDAHAVLAGRVLVTRDELLWQQQQTGRSEISVEEAKVTQEPKIHVAARFDRMRNFRLPVENMHD